ncbi:MAG: response regulator [Tepidisphaeraceae bacterium]|jgi:two-component system KDP operon response regulator KdpE
MSLIAEPKAPVLPASPGVLIVEDEAAISELVTKALQVELHCRVRTAGSIKQAKRIMATEQIDLLVADVGLPDGDGLTLLKPLRARQPLAQAIIITGNPSIDGTIAAMRGGAADLLPKPFTREIFLERARKALYQQHCAAKNEARIESLRSAVKRLNAARQIVSKKVDLLCNDLVGAYGELAGQLDQVRTQEGFRTLLAGAKDLEQLLCHAMDWMLRQLGYCNIAIWLAGHDQFQLGAYMKHTIVGDAGLIEAMRTGLLRKLTRDGFLHLSAADAPRSLSSTEAKLMPDQTVLATHCSYLGESLAAVMLFREGARPFTEADAQTLRSIAPIFAVALAAAVRTDGPGENEAEESDPTSHDEPQGGLDEPGKSKRRKKAGDADWWKRGEPPPY